jgi:hypothetical protein
MSYMNWSVDWIYNKIMFKAPYSSLVMFSRKYIFFLNSSRHFFSCFFHFLSFYLVCFWNWCADICMKKEYNLLTEVQVQIQCMFRTLLYSRPMWLRTCKTLNIYPLDHHHAVIKMRYLLHNQMLNILYW